MSDLNFNNPIILVPTIIIGISVLGAIGYGIKSLVSGNKSNDEVDNRSVSDNGSVRSVSSDYTESVYSSDNESVRNPSVDSYQSVDSNGADFRNPSISSEDSKGGSRKNKKTKRKGKKSKKSKKSKSR